MGKELVKRAGIAGIEELLQTFLPGITSRLDSIQEQVADVRKEVGDVRREVIELRKDMDAKFERTQEVINELGIRINTVGTRLDTYFEFARRDSAKMDTWLERLVRVEEAQKSRSRRAS